MLRKIIVEQVAAIMVLPNKLPITLSDEVAASTLMMPEPEVRLELVFFFKTCFPDFEIFREFFVSM